MKNLFVRFFKEWYAQLNNSFVCNVCHKIVSGGFGERNVKGLTCIKCSYEKLVLDEGVGSVWQSRELNVKLTITKIKRLKDNYEVTASNRNFRVTQFAHVFAMNHVCLPKLKDFKDCP